MSKDVKIRGALVLNLVVLTLQLLFVLWVLGPMVGQFHSVFASMNVELPAVTRLALSASTMLSGLSGTIVALALVAAALVTFFWLLRCPEPLVAMPFMNALQLASYLAMFVAMASVFIPMMKLVNSVG